MGRNDYSLLSFSKFASNRIKLIQIDLIILVVCNKSFCSYFCVKAPGLRFPQVGPYWINIDPLAGTQPRELSR